MRSIKETGNENAKEVLLKMEPHVILSESEYLMKVYSAIMMVLDSFPEDILTSYMGWEFILKFYEECLKVAYNQNKNVNEINWFISITSIVSTNTEEEIKLLVKLAIETSKES